ncbi:flagellar biosynthetic protein FliR, partial [Mesorhizobium sp. M00.F.Ca.ET.216.01.1.1]|uniref:flagellar biosynthetic protein FliR n=1 Tax=Mesorhizobium sp. M00.F.Ca.ET.216.01.1.1 TaxID=2500528 RepID=UPI001FDF7EEF
MTIIFAPTLGSLPQVTVFSAEGVWIIVNQFLIGVALGMTMQIVFQAISATGDFVGLGMGLGFATFFNAQASSSSQVLSSYMYTIAMLVFLVIDGHLQMISALLASFSSLPVSANILGAPGRREPSPR